MANLKSAKKRVHINEKKRAYNQEYRSAMRTSMKEIEQLIAQGNVEKARETFPTTVKRIDKAVQKNAIHKNKGNREKSRLAKKLDAAGA